MNVVFDVHGWLFGFQEKLTLAANTERVIRSLGG
jgi:hypothetical protein